MKLFVRDLDFKWTAVAQCIRGNSSIGIKELAELQEKFENDMFGNSELVNRASHLFSTALEFAADHSPRSSTSQRTGREKTPRRSS